MREEQGSSFFWFLIGLLFGGGLVFFLATKEGKKILSRINIDQQEIEHIKKIFENVTQEEAINSLDSNGGLVNSELELKNTKTLDEQKYLFGHRFFKRKKPS